MSYSDTLDYLRKLQGESGKLSLANVGTLVAGLPFTDAIPFIQVAGTNGKGSTSHFITSILARSGYRVGLFTSPHLIDVRERIVVDGRPISKANFVRQVTFARKLAARARTQGKIRNMPTFFEHLFLAALGYFHSRKVDVAVLEVGLGGRLDATSTVRPEIAVITNVSRDHTNILGRCLADIAAEKAGIIKHKVPVVCGALRGSLPRRIIREKARRKGAPFFDVLECSRQLIIEKRPRSTRCRYESGGRRHRFTVNLAGLHQTLNAAIAVRACDVLRGLGWKIPESAIGRGIASTRMPARIERVAGQAPPLIIDGGHNVEGIRALTAYLAEKRIAKATIIFGVLRDKEYPLMVRELRPFAGRVILTDPPNDRALPGEKLRPFFKGIPTTIEKDCGRALQLAKKSKRIIIVSGSLYLAGAMKRVVGRGGKRGH